MKQLTRFIAGLILFSSCKKELVFKSYDKPQAVLLRTDSRFSSSQIELSNDTVYIISSNLDIYNGQVLKISSGTVIKVDDGLKLTIHSGGRIEAAGTPTAPIVFTSSADKGAPGFSGYQNNSEHSWLGIIINGNYPDPVDETVSGTGLMQYVRIEFAGGIKQNYELIPAIQLNNVGRGTILENIQVSYSVGANSFEFNGGNVNGRNLVAYASGGTDFYLNNGYTGLLQNILVLRHPYFALQSLPSGPSMAGLRISGESTYPLISNLTVIGPDLQTGTNPKYLDTIRVIDPVFGTIGGSRVAAFLVEGGQFNIRNSVLMGFPKGGFFLDNRASAISLQYGQSEFSYSMVHANDSARAFYLTPGIYGQNTSKQFSDFILQPQFHNSQIIQTGAFHLKDPYNYNVHPDPMPAAGSMLLTGANYEGSAFDQPFFEKYAYIGAIGTQNWLKQWTNFIPLQTNYNN